LAEHSLPSCAVPTPAQVELKALGDFPPAHDTSELLSLTAQNVKLGLPLRTLALEATALPNFSDQTFVGYGTSNS
jgi:hypothetical protein